MTGADRQRGRRTAAASGRPDDGARAHMRDVGQAIPARLPYGLAPRPSPPVPGAG
ncbi:hypothetical protein [Streptomyces sp. NBC_00286]|uniref:hypothetical protein n=1 Tax=Streptomyces sp. NBC_00286 TaxID=2975701 RepID=UPI002E2D6AB9|nr:hypothetical protein [Streptomyces sp. NBC_00286]